MFRHRIWILLVGLVVGCNTPEAQFLQNAAYLTKQEQSAGEKFSKEQKQDVHEILLAMFGTPDQPFIPTAGDSGITQVLDMDMLVMAAGKTNSNKTGSAHGLFREHCVHCHGITGDGAGPTAAYLNPYPRDYRKGAFKFKSTVLDSRPTHADLKRIVMNGIPGTAMPSFKLLPDEEIEALVEYVKYLSIRGEVERRLMEDIAIELDVGERLDTSPDYLIDDVLISVVSKWRDAENFLSTVPQRPDWNDEETQASIAHGRDLYFGAGQCTKCHGDTQLGDGEQGDWDDWTKDWYADLVKLTPEERAKKSAELVQLGGLPIRPIRPRNLRLGIYRGGRRPVDLYLRVLNGINGTPMPQAALNKPGDPVTKEGVTGEEIWNIVDYVRTLPYESMGTSGTHATVPTYMKSRL